MDYRLYKEGDDEKIVELLIDSFNGWPHFDLQCSPLEHWRWKYLDNPSGSIIALSFDGEKLSGCQHIIIKQLKVGDHIYNSAVSLDVAVHKDYRGLGEYGNLYRFKRKIEQDYDFKFRNSIESNPKLYKWSIKQGNPKIPHKIIEWINIRDTNKYFKEKPLKKIGYSGLKTLNLIQQLVRNKKTYHESNIQVSETHGFDATFDDFWEKIKPDYKFIYVRNSTYLNWRYNDPRGGEFHVFSAYQSGNLVGYTVLRVNRYHDEPIGYITDLVVDPSQKGLPNLIDKIVEFFESNDVNYVKTWSPKNAVTKLLGNRGYVGKPNEIKIIFDQDTLIPEDFKIFSTSNSEEIMFTLSDHDHI